MPKVDGVEFPYTKAGMQKAKAWSEMTGKPMQKEYQEGGTVHFRDPKQVLDASSLEEVAHKRIPGGSLARYTAMTKGGDQRNLARYIEGKVVKLKEDKLLLKVLEKLLEIIQIMMTLCLYKLLKNLWKANHLLRENY